MGELRTANTNWVSSSITVNAGLHHVIMLYPLHHVARRYVLWVLCQANIPAEMLSNFAVNSHPESPQPVESVEFDIGATYFDDEQKVCIGYMFDPRIYDSGHKITLSLKCNQNEPDAVENKILDSLDMSWEKHYAIAGVMDKVLPNAPPPLSYYYLNYI